MVGINYENKIKKLKTKLIISKGIALILSSIAVIMIIRISNESRSNSGGYVPDFIEQEIQAFNSRFVAYEGSELSGTRIKNLVMIVIGNNNKEKDTNYNRFVTIEFDEKKYKKEEITKLIDDNIIDKNKKYSVEVKYEKNRYINEVKISSL